ncbi:ABC transporter family protein [Histomonas meleagridis]|uniref:ABC transporter family protein n=1 Tax=Histomonas meleagridis TaxID=135588 RepID=UPI00355A3B5F|nr:ABC transporter family protein [Histomonas meleagridis]KAH0801806.1 ABC transporter family protein [Histomonas meleagridis]
MQPANLNYKRQSEYSIDMSLSVEKVTGDYNKREEFSARLTLYGMVMKYPKAIIGVLPSLVFGAIPILSFLFFGNIINALTAFESTHGEERDFDSVRNNTIYLVIIAIVEMICKFLDSFLWIKVGSEFVNDLRGNVFEKIMMSDVSFFDITPIGEILTLLGEETQSVQDNFGITKGQQFQFIGQFLVGIIFSYIYSWKMALIATCVVPYFIIVIAICSKYIDRHLNLKFYYTGKQITIADETLSNIRTVRGFNREDAEYERFMVETRRTTHEDRLTSLFITIMFVLVDLGTWTMIVGNIYYGGTLVEDGELNAGNLLSIFGYLMFGCIAIISLQMSMQGEEQAIHAGKKILEILRSEPRIPFSGGEIIENFKGHIEFRNVSFKYPTRDVYVLKNVSFEIKPGQMGALVGHSGSGKSTCVQLLERFYDVTEGVILLDGKDIKTLDPRWLHQKTSLVSQEPILFQLSVKDNIKYGVRDATDDMIREAAEKANAIKFIEKLEGKFDYFVGEKGDTVSGGQRQRIAIARALIKDPVILITDEATSALDSASEKKVQIALDEVMKNRTSVIVAHRLSTIRNAHVIYVFDAGEIKEIGNHESLVKKRGHYYDLVRRQMTEEDIQKILDEDKKQQTKEEKPKTKAKDSPKSKKNKKIESSSEESSSFSSIESETSSEETSS